MLHALQRWCGLGYWVADDGMLHALQRWCGLGYY